MTADSSPIRVVLFTGGPVLDWQVVSFLERLERDPDIELVGIFSQSPHTALPGVVRDLWARRRLLAIPLLLQLLFRWVCRVISSPRAVRRRRELRSKLEFRTHFVKDIHDRAVIDQVSGLRPDLGLVYGGPIVKKELFEIPRHGTLGIHHGKVPEYRGKKTTFWAMYNGEKEVGVIIQQIGNRLDGGDIVMQSTIAIGRRTLPSVKRQLEKEGIDLYVRAIHAVSNGSMTRFAQQFDSTPLYKDPGAADIIRFWYRYVLRLVRQ